MTANEILSILKRPSAVDYMIEMRDALERHFVESEKKFLKQRKGMKKTEQADARQRRRDSFNKLQRKQP